MSKQRRSAMQRRELRKPSKNLRLTLAENLLAFRRVKQITQEELALLCGMNRTYVGSVERAERNVSLSTLEALAKALDTTVVALLTPSDPARLDPHSSEVSPSLPRRNFKS